MTLDEKILKLIDDVLEIPNAISANLETGSHNQNNAAAAKWAGENRILVDHLSHLLVLAAELENNLENGDHD